MLQIQSVTVLAESHEVSLTFTRGRGKAPILAWRVPDMRVGVPHQIDLGSRPGSLPTDSLAGCRRLGESCPSGACDLMC